jgi:hypothetical protein
MDYVRMVFGSNPVVFAEDLNHTLSSLKSDNRIVDSIQYQMQMCEGSSGVWFSALIILRD